MSWWNRGRQVVRSVSPQPQTENGVAVIKPIGDRSELEYLDPFVELGDYFIPSSAGFPDHPHAGVEMVTYVLEGGIAFHDSKGHQAILNTGDVQWMTVGGGVIHSEMPACQGLNRVLQLWINLPSSHKRMQPEYRETSRDDIHVVSKSEGVEAKVLHDVGQGITTVILLDVTMDPGSEWHERFPGDYSVFAYVIEGEGVFGCVDTPPAPAKSLVVLGPGEWINAWNLTNQRLRFLLGLGVKVDEPVVQYKTFVMNSQAEIDRAIQEYLNRRNAFE